MHVTESFEIEAPAPEAWKVLGEGFGTIGEWSCGIAASTLDGGLRAGGVRACHSSGSFGPFKAGVVEERLLEFDPSAMTFEYQAISGLPGWLKTARNRWSIRAVGAQRCEVSFHATIELSGVMRMFGPLMKLLMRPDMAKLKEEIIYRIVHGRPHPRKLASNHGKEAAVEPA